MGILGLLLNYIAIGVVMLVVFNGNKSKSEIKKDALFVMSWPIKLLIMAAESIKVTLTVNKDK